MAAPSLPGGPRRHRGTNRLAGERRTGQRDTGSSRDASEEDNDEPLSDVGSLMSVPKSTISSHTARPQNPSQAIPMQPLSNSGPPGSGLVRRGPSTMAPRRLGELSGEGSQSEGLDSPTYDGDIESTSTVEGTPIHQSTLQMQYQRRNSSPTREMAGPGRTTQSPFSPYGQRLPTPKASQVNLSETDTLSEPIHTTQPIPTDVPVAPSTSLPEPKKSQTLPLSNKPSNSALGPPRMKTRPIELPVEEIRAFVQRAIDGEGAQDGVYRDWRTRPPPPGRPVRIYADGVYDLFHFGHALQLRQAKLSLPNVQLLVGVVSDELCAAHKSAPCMSHAERCEAVRHCRWADEILPDAPWVVDQAWMDKHNIDYIAHDEVVYPSKDHADVYQFAKDQGSFLPTRRTPAISTSDLLERIVRGYRDGFFDSKLEKNGLTELMAAEVDWSSSPSRSRRHSIGEDDKNKMTATGA